MIDVMIKLGDIYMNKNKKLENPFPNQKFIKITAFLEKGYSHYMINRMVEEQLIKKINRNTYENIEYNKDESDYLYVSGYINGGVVCLLSAAVYYNLSTYRPSQVDVAIRQYSKVNILPEWPSIALYYFSNDRYETGINKINIEGGSINIYDMEKTVCDIVFYRNKIGVDEAVLVLKNYLSREDRNLNKLVYYAKKLRCYNTLKKYLEVLL